MRNEYLALSSHCLEGGEAATIDFILNRHVIKTKTIEILYQKHSSFFFQRVIFRSTNPMIVTWSETYLHTSLTNAFTTIHSSPPNISSYLVQPTPIIERNVHVTPSSTTQLSSIINKTDHERAAAAAAAAATTSSSSWQSNLPDVCIY